MRKASKLYLLKDNIEKFKDNVFINEDLIISSIQHCYNTIDLIDETLKNNNVQPLSQLMELANLSSLTGNIITSGFEKYSNKIYKHNKPNTYPDLVYNNKPNLSNSNESDLGIEIKVALERNLPKGHLIKEGYYLIFRYVLTDENGNYTPQTRGTTFTIWEVKLGYLHKSDFLFSNTKKDSGKTAIIKTQSLHNLKLLYFVPKCCPYKLDNYNHYKGYN